ncbi:hypothetical protein [Streptomyces sp. NPDC049916]|uniref:hypothetical protein n=1 Tax=Streptomyces sp. NPDC049916 TaxID=3155156 RepID=UPI00344A7FE7
MRGAGYAAEVTVLDGLRLASLGAVTVRNRRLVLLWLRRQALRLAEGHGFPPVPAVPHPPAWAASVRPPAPVPPPASVPPPDATGDVRPVRFHGPDAPAGLRAWATDGGLQDEAIRVLEAGFPLLFTVVDPAVGLSLTLAGWRGSLADL